MSTLWSQPGCDIQCSELRLQNGIPRLVLGKVQLCIATDYHFDDNGDYVFDQELKLYAPEDAHTCKVLNCTKFTDRGYIESIVGDKIIFHIATGPQYWKKIMRFENTLVVKPTAIPWFQKYCEN